MKLRTRQTAQKTAQKTLPSYQSLPAGARVTPAGVLVNKTQFDVLAVCQNRPSPSSESRASLVLSRPRQRPLATRLDRQGLGRGPHPLRQGAF